MRAAYQDKLSESGFIVRHLIMKPNTEKKRVRLLLNSTDQTAILNDSMNYYKQIMKGSDYTDILDPHPLGLNYFAKKIDNNAVLVNFKDCLQISYANKKEDPEYHLRNVGVYPDSCITAIVTMTNENPIAVSSSGSFDDVTNLTLMGYWAWSEKVAKMLPFDYWP